MKKKIKSLIPNLFIAARRLTVRSCGYPCKNPSKEQKEFYRKTSAGRMPQSNYEDTRTRYLWKIWANPTAVYWECGAISGRRILPILPSFTAILTVLLNTSSLEVKHSEAPFRRTKRSVNAASSEYK